MTESPPWTTHQVFNQSDVLQDQNLFTGNRALQDALRHHLPGADLARLTELGVWAGSADAQQHARLANQHPPLLHSHDRSGTCQAGDLLLADVGSETETGWASDVTRTWPVSGTFSRSQP